MADKRDILVFGGTSEGRRIVEWLEGRDCGKIVACTATAYGSSLLPQGAGTSVEIVQGPLSPTQKEQLVASHDFACIVDATHPFATHISESIADMARRHSIDLLRVARADYSFGAEDAFDTALTVVATPEEAAISVAQWAKREAGNILLTTGSKDLATFTSAVPDFEKRLYVRVLPVAESLARAQEAGVPSDHVIAMQGPFSTQMNCAIIREYGIGCMVSKQSGAAGGFGEKLAAAQECGIEFVVIQRPQTNEDDGLSLEEAQVELEARYGF